MCITRSPHHSAVHTKDYSAWIHLEWILLGFVQTPTFWWCSKDNRFYDGYHQVSVLTAHPDLLLVSLQGTDDRKSDEEHDDHHYV